MSKQLVYRIEEKNTKSGPVFEGPYFNSYGGAGQWRERSHDTRKHPTCDKDKTLVKNFNKQKFSDQLYKNSDFYCCFTDIDQLTKWFNEKERWNLEMQGFVLAVYEADIVVSSTKQALFSPKKGKKRKILKMPM
jgi:hypothetical protein